MHNAHQTVRHTQTKAWRSSGDHALEEYFTQLHLQ